MKASIGWKGPENESCVSEQSLALSGDLQGCT
jgi:hypothetical protein